MIAGAYGYEVPPVPIPNTEVKLIHAEDTQMVTSRENRAAPALIIFISYSSIAQSVERMTVNHDVAGSSPAWGAIYLNPNSGKGSDFFISGKGVYLNILKNMVLHFKSSFGTIYRKI